MKPTQSGKGRGKSKQVIGNQTFRHRVDPNTIAAIDGKTKLLSRLDRAMLLVLLAACALIPLIVFLKGNELTGVKLEFWTGTEEHIDFFNWYKSMALNVVLVLLVGLHTAKYFITKQALEMPRLFIPVVFFEVLAILSAIASKVPDIAFGGFVDRSEGMWAILCYGVLAYTAFTLSKTTRIVRIVVTAIFVSSIVIAGIGLFQFLGYDFFQTDFGKRLILPKAFEIFVDQLTFNFGKNIMYTTVYNPNYLGSYASLLLPVSWGITLFWAEDSKKKNNEDSKSKDSETNPSLSKANPFTQALTNIYIVIKPIRWFFGILFTLCIFVLWLGSMSRAGLIGGFVAMFFFVLFQIKTMVKNPIPSALLIFGMVAAFIFMNTASGNLIQQEFQKTLPSRVQQAIGQVPVTEEVVSTAPVGIALPEGVPPVPPQVLAVRLKDNQFTFETETETLIIVMDKTADGKLTYYDGNSSSIDLMTDAAGTQRFTDKRFIAYNMSVTEDSSTLYWYQYSFMFQNKNGVMNYIPKPNTSWTEVEPAPFIGFQGHERFATNRGWIWSRTFPILGKSIFLGYGPDTFAVFFPQKDIAGKINLYGASNIIVDKPHNWYLQTAVNTGVISMLMILWFLAGLMLDGLRARLRIPVKSMEAFFGEPVEGEGKADKQLSMDSILLTGLICGVLGYALAGVFNDSVVSVAPIFWTVTGLAAGMLRFCKRAPANVKSGIKMEMAKK